MNLSFSLSDRAMMRLMVFEVSSLRCNCEVDVMLVHVARVINWLRVSIEL